jgi:DNA-binding NarL/FixJ family response regulator
MHILILDDHVLVREGLASVVLSLMPAARIDFAGNCADALVLGLEHRPNIAFIDLQLPDQPGFYALEQFRAQLPETSVVVVSGNEDKASVIRALDLGARAFLPKSASSESLRTSIAKLLSGQVVLPQSVLGLEKTTTSTPAMPEQQTPDFYADQIGITVRQFHVLGLVVAGLSNKVIARQLNIAEATVKIHVSAGLRALKVNTRTQALVEIAKLAIPFGKL